METSLSLPIKTRINWMIGCPYSYLLHWLTTKSEHSFISPETSPIQMILLMWLVLGALTRNCFSFSLSRLLSPSISSISLQLNRSRAVGFVRVWTISNRKIQRATCFIRFFVVHLWVMGEWKLIQQRGNVFSFCFNSKKKKCMLFHMEHCLSGTQTEINYVCLVKQPVFLQCKMRVIRMKETKSKWNLSKWCAVLKQIYWPTKWLTKCTTWWW